MATKAATKQKSEDVEKPEVAQGAGGEAPDGPLLDLSDAAVKKLIKTAKKRGYVTYEELTAVLPSVASSDFEIARYAHAQHVDLIAMATKGHGLTRSLLGLSITDRTLQAASTPVLVSHAP